MHRGIYICVVVDIEGWNHVIDESTKTLVSCESVFGDHCFKEADSCSQL